MKQATVKDCGHKRIRGYDERDGNGELTHRVICEKCYYKNNWVKNNTICGNIQLHREALK